VLGNSNTSDGKALARDANGVLYYGHGRDTNNPTVVYCSTDDGARWSACDSGLPQFLEAHRFALNPTDRKLYVVVQDKPNDLGYLYRTNSVRLEVEQNQLVGVFE
jgi:hypothetical protein